MLDAAGYPVDHNAVIWAMGQSPQSASVTGFAQSQMVWCNAIRMPYRIEDLRWEYSPHRAEKVTARSLQAAFSESQSPETDYSMHLKDKPQRARVVQRILHQPTEMVHAELVRRSGWATPKTGQSNLVGTLCKMDVGNKRSAVMQC